MKLSIAHPAAILAGIALFLPSTSTAVTSQRIISAKAGNIQFVYGEVFLDGTPVTLRDGQFLQMESDQVLSTKEGYVEQILAPDACLRLGENASLRMRENKLDDIQIELTHGAAFIEIPRKLKASLIRVNVSNSVIEVKREGLYRIDADPSLLRVYGGEAVAGNDRKKVKIKKGRTLSLGAGRSPEALDYNDKDLLHWWSAMRSFALYSKSLFFSKPLKRSEAWYWKERPGGIVYNEYYRLSVPRNIDWKRYWEGLSDMQWKELEEYQRIQESLPQIMQPGGR
jgi:hypothetical protein